jgi:hypothetical protein
VRRLECTQEWWRGVFWSLTLPSLPNSKLPSSDLLLLSHYYCVQGRMYSGVVEARALEPDLAILPSSDLLLLSHSYYVQGGMYSRVMEACAQEPDLAILHNKELLLLSYYYCV